MDVHFCRSPHCPNTVTAPALYCSKRCNSIWPDSAIRASKALGASDPLTFKSYLQFLIRTGGYSLVQGLLSCKSSQIDRWLARIPDDLTPIIEIEQFRNQIRILTSG